MPLVNGAKVQLTGPVRAIAFITRMANADVPLDVRKALSGHSTDSAHARYVSLELDTQKRAIVKLPIVELATVSALTNENGADRDSRV